MLVPTICKGDIMIRSLQRVEQANEVSLPYRFPLQTNFLPICCYFPHFWPSMKNEVAVALQGAHTSS